MTTFFVVSKILRPKSCLLCHVIYNGMLKAKLTAIEILTKPLLGCSKKIHQNWSSISQTEESEKQLCRAGILVLGDTNELSKIRNNYDH